MSVCTLTHSDAFGLDESRYDSFCKLKVKHASEKLEPKEKLKPNMCDAEVVSGRKLEISYLNIGHILMF